jgi:hypothetical protein
MLQIVKDFLKEFSEKYGSTQTSIERVLDLKQGSLKDEEGPEVVALIKMIRTYPWLLEVAARNYNDKDAKNIIINVVVHELVEANKETLKQQEIENAKSRQRCKSSSKSSKKNSSDAKVSKRKSKKS